MTNLRQIDRSNFKNHCCVVTNCCNT